MPYALASEYDRLSPEQQAAVTHIIADDGDWTQGQIDAYIHMPIDTKEQEELGR